MGSQDIDSIRREYPGKSDSEAAKAFAQRHGYIAIIRYKNSRHAADFTDIGTCKTEAEIRGYLTSPYCHYAEIIFDDRSALFPLNADHVLNGRCEICKTPSTRDTLQIGGGNDFYFCPKCGLLFCDGCYVRLPLTGSPGYGTCPRCRVQVKRAIPSFYVSGSRSEPGNSGRTRGKGSGLWQMFRNKLFGAKESTKAGLAQSKTTQPPPISHVQFRSIQEAACDDLERFRTQLGDNPGLVLGRNPDGYTLLHWAADNYLEDIAKLLLAKGADVNAKAENKDGWTPLHLAAQAGGKGAAELLLANGADVNAKDNHGTTPLRYATKRGHKDVAELLRQHGGHE